MHPMQRLIPSVPVTGETPDQDPDYGRSYRVVEQVAMLADEIQEEVWFDGILTSADGNVHLTAGGTAWARSPSACPASAGPAGRGGVERVARTRP